MGCTFDGLTPGTAYHFIAAATNGDGPTKYGYEMIFYTLPSARGGPPVIRVYPPVTVRSRFATLMGMVNPNGLTTGYYFEWYKVNRTVPQTPRTSCHGSLPADTRWGTIYCNLDLTPSTTYQFHIIATNSAGVILSTEVRFTTPSS